MARHRVGLGTHSIRPHRIHDGNGDLSSGRQLCHSLRRLDRKRKGSPLSYAVAWIEEAEDINLWANAHCDREGEWGLRVGFPCDGQEDARRVRYDALDDHLHHTPGGRAALIEYLRMIGRKWDDRDVRTSDLFSALRPLTGSAG